MRASSCVLMCKYRLRDYNSTRGGSSVSEKEFFFGSEGKELHLISNRMLEENRATSINYEIFLAVWCSGSQSERRGTPHALDSSSELKRKRRKVFDLVSTVPSAERLENLVRCSSSLWARLPLVQVSSRLCNFEMKNASNYRALMTVIESSNGLCGALQQLIENLHRKTSAKD